MDIQWVLFGAVLVLNALVSIAIAGFLAWKYEASGRVAMILMLLSLAVWSFGYAMITFSLDMEAKRFWLRVENIGILSQPIFWLIFTLNYSNQGRSLARPYLIAMCIVPLISAALIFSDRWFHLYYTVIKPYSVSGGPLVIGRGAWYWVALVQSYLLNGIGTVLLIWRFIEFRNIFRRQLALLITAALIPWVVNVLYQLISNLAPTFFIPIDLTPISFTISIGLLSSGIFRIHLLDLVPIARDVVMENIPEMVFVVDAHDRVLDANKVAEKWLGRTKEELIGRDPVEIFRQWPEFLNRFLSTQQTREEVQIPGAVPRMLELMVTPLYDPLTKELNGRVILAYDVTARKQGEVDLAEMNEILWTKIAEVDSLREQLQEKGVQLEEKNIQLQELAIHDALTGVFNRRFLTESLDIEIARAERDHTPVSIVMMDVDHFKKFNDTHGHKCGDLVLKDLAEFLSARARESDIVCRFGGEEFVILMPNATSVDAYERAESWRRGYAEKAFHFEGQALHTTFSAGVASYPAHGTGGDAILHAADDALYRSKSLGRNQVTLYVNEASGAEPHAN